MARGMRSSDRHRFLALVAIVAIVVIAGAVFCLLHAHEDGLELCAQVLALGSMTVGMLLLPLARSRPTPEPALGLTALELISPPPRG